MTASPRPAEPALGAAAPAPRTPEEPLRETGFTAIHRQLGAKLVPFAGTWMPIQYESITAEHRAVRERAGLFDISHMGEFHVSGPGAASFLDRITVNDVAALAPHQAQYSCICNADGGIKDDVVVYRLEDGYLVVVNASNIEKDFTWLAEQRDRDVQLADRSDETSLLALQGPRSEAILTRLSSVDLARIRYYWMADGRVAGIETMISRTGYTGEIGFELYFQRDHSAAMWQALMEAGAAEGLVPAGLGARDSLRLEMKYPLYGNDIDEQTNPLEAGLGWIVKLEKGDFIGREALRRARTGGLTRKLVGFELEERGFPRPDYSVVLGDRKVSEVRSGILSPTLGRGIGTCYLPLEHARVGTPIGVEIRGRHLAARVSSTPFYREGSLRR